MSKTILFDTKRIGKLNTAITQRVAALYVKLKLQRTPIESVNINTK